MPPGTRTISVREQTSVRGAPSGHHQRADEALSPCLGELGFTDVESYATSGNLLFNARSSDPAALERRIAARVGTAVFVRTPTEMARVVAQDPLGAMVMFLAHPPAAAKRHGFLDLDFQEPHPVLRGRTVFFSFPLLLRGRRTPFDIERALDVEGTFRTARVAAALLARMLDRAAGSR
jgi:hypothetical protein